MLSDTRTVGALAGSNVSCRLIIVVMIIPISMPMMLLISMLKTGIAWLSAVGLPEQVANDVLHPRRQRRQAIRQILPQGGAMLRIGEDRLEPFEDTASIIRL